MFSSENKEMPTFNYFIKEIFFHKRNVSTLFIIWQKEKTKRSVKKNVY